MRLRLLALVLTACTQATPSKPVAKTAPPPAPPSSSVAPTPSPPTIPELGFEPFRVEGKPLKRVFAIEGATIVTTDNVVGYIDGDRVEWIAKVPKDRPNIGHNIIEHVDGKYLDRIDVVMETDNGRALSPIWLPLTGKGTLHDEAAGGGFGSILEARVGDSVLIATSSTFNNDRIVTVRGPSLTRKLTNAKGCKGYYDQAWIQASIDEHAAVRPIGFQATGTGTLVAVGNRCGEDKPFAEVWAAGSTSSRLVDLGAHWKRVSHAAKILRAGEDGLWMYNGEYQRLVQFQNGEFKPVPGPDAPISDAFLSTKGQLHVRAVDEILRLEPSGKWEAVARLASLPQRLSDFVMDDAGRFWASSRDEVYRLRETKQVPAERACRGWFVSLAEQNTARAKAQAAELTKIVANYPKGDGLKLIMAKSWPSVIGVSLGSRAEADAFVTYLATALPTEKPAEFCSDVSTMQDYAKEVGQLK
jgi:hypothetical protein